METLSRRFNSTFGTLKGKHSKLNSSGPTSTEDNSNLSPNLLSPDLTIKMDNNSATQQHSVGAPSANGTTTTTGKFSSRHIRSASGTSTQSSGVCGGAASRSISMNSVSSTEGYHENHVVEQEEIVALTQDVRGFKETLSRLRRIFHPDREKLENLRVASHERLGEVLRILRAILEKYPPLQSTELLMAAGHLIQQVKDCHYEDNKCNPMEFFDTIDQLALAFSSRKPQIWSVTPSSPVSTIRKIATPIDVPKKSIKNKFLLMLQMMKKFICDAETVPGTIPCTPVKGALFRVSEYLMGDIDTSSSVQPAIRTRSCENLIPNPDCESFEVTSTTTTTKELREPYALTAEELDDVLMKLDCGVNLALHRAKVWSKYAKDVMNYIEKRATLEAEHSRNLEKLAQNMRSTFKEESFLPFQSIYWTALDQDIENANFCQATCTLLKEHKFVEPMSARRSEHEKQRKQIKEMWQRECKKTQEAVGNLRKARSQYIQRNVDYEKAKESVLKVENSDTNEASKLDKKKRLEEDAWQKVMDAEFQYRSCVDIANERHHVLETTKAFVLQQVRELMFQCDQTMKAVTVCYFQLQHTISAQAPVQFQTLCESSRLYEPCSQYLEFIKKIPIPTSPTEGNTQPFFFEAYSADNKMPERKSVDSCETPDESIHLPHRLNDGRDKLRVHHAAKAWSPAVTAVLGSDSDSIGSSQSNKSRDTSPTASPQVPARRVTSHGSSGDELDIDGDFVENGYGTSNRRTCLSKAAVTHSLRKLRTLAKCRECDTYVYFQGVECSQCGLASHKKCLESLAIQCGHRRLPRRMTTFGVDLSSHLQEAEIAVPHIVIKCVAEVDRRGSQIKGIYRVSGVKSRVEKLCQSFENGANLVDLSDVHPNVIANVLKLYLRQLPEPLLTFRLYPEFIRIAKESQSKPNESEDREQRVLQELKEIVRKLPAAHRNTLSALIHHLKRVSDVCDDNNMPPSNLGIVFGPTLLRSSEVGASLTSLVDTVHQAKVVELLILNVDEVFGDDISSLPVVSNSRSHENVRTDSLEQRKHSAGDETEPHLLHKKLQSTYSDGGMVTKSSRKSYVNTQSQNPEEWTRGVSGESGGSGGPTSSEATSSDIIAASCVQRMGKHPTTDHATKNMPETRHKVQSGTPSSTTVGRFLPDTQTLTATSDTSKTQPTTVASNTRNSEKTKGTLSAGVATQTDLSFLRNLVMSPVPPLRQQGGSSQSSSSDCTASSFSSSSTSKPAPTTRETSDKIVIHVAGANEKVSSSDMAVQVTEANNQIEPKQWHEVETNAPSSLEFALEEDRVSRGKIDGERWTLQLTPQLQNQLDQDSGFEDARPSPDCSPSNYVSPYLSNYSSKLPYRGWTTTTTSLSSTKPLAESETVSQRNQTTDCSKETTPSCRSSILPPTAIVTDKNRSAAARSITSDPVNLAKRFGGKEAEEESTSLSQNNPNTINLATVTVTVPCEATKVSDDTSQLESLNTTVSSIDSMADDDDSEVYSNSEPHFV